MDQYFLGDSADIYVDLTNFIIHSLMFFFTFSTHVEGSSTGAEQSIRKCNHVSFNQNVLHILFYTLQEILRDMLRT